jgi:hypothetical protein
LLLHVGVEHGGVAGAGGGDEVHLVADGLGGVLVQAGAVAGDDEGGLRRVDVRRDLAGAAEDQARSSGMDADRQAVVQVFPRTSVVGPVRPSSRGMTSWVK